MKTRTQNPSLVVYGLTALFAAASLVPGAAAQPSADEIVRKANLAAYYAGKDGRAQVRMTISDASGNERLRQFTILRRNRSQGGGQDYLVVFQKPADLRKAAFLVHKKTKGSDDRWMYLPALDLVKRIAAGDKRTSFVGSHFLYEDISGRGIDEDRHTLVKETKKSYVIDNVPKDASAVEFARYRIYIDRETYLPRKIEYFDATGKKFRTIEALAMEVIAGHPTVTRSKVSDLKGGGHTVLEFRRVQYDIGIGDDAFEERALRNPPQAWLRGRK